MPKNIPNNQIRLDFPAKDIVAKLWHLCNILRDSGITYPEYVTELTYLLFLRMAEESGSESALPTGYRWRDLASKSNLHQFTFYKELLKNLGSNTKGRIKEIFTDADTSLTNPAHLSLLVTEFGNIDWYAAREESVLADVYEGLLEKNSTESKAGAGQYFTPRPLIECMVHLTNPEPGEIIQDPACGTIGFLVAADRYIKQKTKNLASLTKTEKYFQTEKAFIGVELVPKTHRLALMNAMLHGIHSPIILGDTLGEAGQNLSRAHLILTNPPFGTKKGGGLPNRTDFNWRVSNKQLCFLQHVYNGLRPGGRAAVVIPDLQGSVAAEVCADLMEKCNLHTILRLPTGIFYAQGVKANVFFFTRGKTDKKNTKIVWIFDLRANMPAFGKRTPFTRAHLAEFENAFGKNSYGLTKRKVSERFRCFTREEIKSRGDNLDIGWLRDEAAAVNNAELPAPEKLLVNVMSKLRAALEEMESLEQELSK
ncbi:SAM-dependent methyltransferase [Spartobacteria bacterium LR76]|nr:SAM-dependent methyltransferase [Spartobacteria bacterium LR76]